MWILTKHPPPLEGIETCQFYLLAGRKYVIGRKDCDILIPGDISISRRHAVITLTNVTSNDPNQSVESIMITDTSKVGVLINGIKIPSNEATAIKNNDLISFGRMHIKYRLVYQRLAVVTSCISSSSSKSSVKTCVQKLGGYITSNWSDKATHLVMEKVTFTLKVVCAIACGKSIVSVKYLEDLLDCCDKKRGKALPQEKDYLPSISEQSLTHHELLFYPNTKRSTLLIGKMFIALHSQQFSRIKDTIQFAGGEVVLKDSKDAKLVKGFCSSQMIVIQVEKKEEKSMTKDQTAWMGEVYAQLKKHNLRSIRESEVGLAIFHVTLTQYCNPTLKSAPSVSGTTHTQVFAESMCVNSQQTQVEMCVNTQQTQVEMCDATQPLEESQVYRSVSIARKVASDQASTETIPVSSSTASNDTNETREANSNTASKRKRPLNSNNDTQQKNDECSVKKKKIKEEPPSSCKVVEDNSDDFLNLLTSETPKRNENIDKESKVVEKTNMNRLSSQASQRKNIVKIDDEDDEDDCFSFNYSKSASYSRKIDNNTTQTQSTTVQVNPTPAPTVNPESDVLFKSLSRRAEKVPDSCQSSVMSPATKRLANDTLLPSAVTPLSKKTMLDISSENVSVPESISLYQTNEDTRLETETSRLNRLNGKRSRYNDSDEDDPFSFSVDTAATNKSTARDKTERRDRQSNPTKNNVKETDKLVSDSDSSLNKSNVSEEEKQNSRYLKAMSSSQDSDPDSIYLSDGAGNIVPTARHVTETVDRKPKIPPPEVLSTDNGRDNGADMSHLLDDDIDDELVSGEYSLQNNQNNHVRLTGFISSDDMQPRQIIKEENSEIIGMNTNLVQTVFLALVVKQPTVKKAPQKTVAKPGSTLRNFKCFKKQHFVGRRKANGIIGKRDLIVYTNDNVERATLFAEIREKDEEEAAENRRIDKMFEMAPSGKSRKR